MKAGVRMLSLWHAGLQPSYSCQCPVALWGPIWLMMWSERTTVHSANSSLHIHTSPTLSIHCFRKGWSVVWGNFFFFHNCSFSLLNLPVPFFFCLKSLFSLLPVSPLCSQATVSVSEILWTTVLTCFSRTLPVSPQGAAWYVFQEVLDENARWLR